LTFNTLDSFNFKGKRVLLRADVNSDVDKGKVLMSERIKEAAITIKELIKKKAKVVILAHQGNPGKEDFLSLKQHAVLLNQFVKVKFIDDIVGPKALDAINNLKNGEVLLLDNVRNLEEELNPKKYPENRLSYILAPKFDIYINDAFSVCHRDHSSITVLPKVIKKHCAGRLTEKEIKALEKISIKDCLYILGGAKPEENIKLLTGKKVLACGLFGQLCLVASGKNLGYQNEFLKKATLIKGDYKQFMDTLKGKLTNVELPIDFAVNQKKERTEYDLSKFPLKYEIEDIGKKTQKKYIEMIKKAPAIYMKGPAGNTTERQYMEGTEAILKAAQECKGFTLVGGGHLSEVIAELKLDPKKYGHISLSGGALLTYVAGEKLVGLEAIGIKQKL
jgi:phosphoglycerate kinase